MRTLTVAEIGQVHGANAFTDWLGDVWDDVQHIFGSNDEANAFTEQMDDLYESIVDGTREPGLACEMLSIMLRDTPTQYATLDPERVARWATVCADASNRLQDAMEEREHLMEDAGANNNTNDFQAEDYFSNSSWLDEMMYSWNDWVVDSFWDNYNDNAYVEIEFMDYC